jgi:serine/threonine-protein kinase RsbW
MHDEVRLVMPADPEFLRLARVTAMGLASRLQFTLDEIEDLRIAIDELIFALIGVKGREGEVQLQYRLQPEGLEVVGTGQFEDDITFPGLTEMSELILNAVTDEHDLNVNGRSSSFRMLKRRTTGEG